ncbi:MAG TPA: thioredoxin [Anaerolineales bacterium]|nr:thioredoxin [Anaerolineales bacterium]
MATVFDTPITTNDQSIDRVLAAGLPVTLVFVDGKPDTEVERTLKDLARRHAGDLLVVKVPLKDNPATAGRFLVRRAPAVVTIRDGKPLSQAETVSASEIVQHTAYLLGQGPKPVSPPPAQAGFETTRPAPAASAGGDAHPWTVTDATFDQEVLRSSQPVMVDFWAPWCGPCRMVEPILEKFAREFAGRLRIAKVNVDENPQLSERFGVTGIPTMLVVKNGQIVDRWTGALPEPAMRSRLSPILAI